MKATPLAISESFCLNPRYSETTEVSSSKASIRGNVTLLATMRWNTNVASSGTIRLSASSGPSTVSRIYPRPGRGHSLRMMATVLGRAPSTVSRELARNTARGRPYRACTAQVQAAARACQPRRPRKLLDPWLWQYVRTHLTQGCSPEQIAGRLRRAYPDNMRKQLSAETIYAGLYVLPRGTLRAHCCRALLRRARRAGLCATNPLGHMRQHDADRRTPGPVASRTVPGH